VPGLLKTPMPLQEKIRSRSYELPRHALDQSIRRAISVSELEEALLGSIAIIEDYPDDKYGPSCLVLGYTSTGHAFHVLWRNSGGSLRNSGASRIVEEKQMPKNGLSPTPASASTAVPSASAYGRAVRIGLA
jgi:hypothetical protein